MSHSSSRWSRLLLATILLASCVGCDQATKQIATQTLRGAPPRSFFADTVRLEYALNPGAFLSVGSRLPAALRFWLFTVANTALLCGLVIFLARRWNMPLLTYIPLVLLLAGAIGNMIDRVLHGGLVTDFIILSIGPVHTGIFNVADVAITGGGVALVLFYRGNRSDEPELGANEP